MSLISRFFSIVGFPTAVNRFSNEVTVFDDKDIVIMTGGGSDTEDETNNETLKLKLNEIDNVNNGNNIFEQVKLSNHSDSSSGLLYYMKFHSVQTISEPI